MSEPEDYAVWKAYAENLQAQRQNDSATIQELEAYVRELQIRLATTERLLRTAHLQIEWDDDLCDQIGEYFAEQEEK